MNEQPFKYAVFGDESISNNMVIYALVIVPENIIRDGERALAEAKQEVGVDPATELHCKILFHSDPRKNSAWAELTMEEIWVFLEDLAKRLSELELSFRIGIINKSNAPKKLKGSDPFPRDTDLQDKPLIWFAFQIACGPLDANPGFDRIKLFVDPDTTKIKIFGRGMQLGRNFKMYSDLSGKPEPVFIEAESFTGDKPVLLQVADFLAYISSHALSQQALKEKERYKKIYNILRPKSGELTIFEDLKWEKNNKSSSSI